MVSVPPTAGLIRRLLSMVYEALILAAVVMLAGLVFIIPLTLLTGHDASAGAARWLFQIYLVAVPGVYFSWFWLHGGQTLPMRAWRLRVVAADDRPLTRRAVLLRYLYAWPSVLAGGAGLVWALFDRDRQFLHDRLAGTRLVRVDPLPPATSAQRSDRRVDGPGQDTDTATT